MRYTLLEDPVTHRFAFLPLPHRGADDSELPLAVPDRWFDSHAEAIAALPGLFDLEECQAAAARDNPAQGPEGRIGSSRQH